MKLEKIIYPASLDTSLVPLIEKINGVERKYFTGKTLKIPRDSLEGISYCPLQEYDRSFIGYDSLIVVYRAENLLGVYEQGFLVYWAPITRARSLQATPNGKYRIQHKWRMIRSKKYGNVPMPYALHIIGNVCIHHGPMPGYNNSHGCIRLLKTDAVWLYEWSRAGIDVIIY